MASSNVDSIKRHLDFSHSEILKDMEASQSLLHKIFKPLKSEGKWGISRPLENGGGPSSTTDNAGSTNDQAQRKRSRSSSRLMGSDIST
ncbi:hypothetical protein L1887_03339 [Cichorium endivia]|nr:hypothetical protein L1887_03339 [Cichorium endivia]